ncbi:AbrB/MazE/SpoVT family DNA-binding domain-containing protein [Halonotius terrestris]|uniref:AbrB/MazE/SpoVT family DNA-binding domain-containing protein n=1 Tax=Halonotius terrestris TaxID=2487750 RepID=A0A8J8TE06_9EURY|nr:AbrB/MazE/SpoVT family DNA-binding domain-containing protein [Halonotius terrestris]TQQ83847.1 AbrB/MazE/SpoVT family DNA-binding domain-containing protein [Halonotius terrestris]
MTVETDDSGRLYLSAAQREKYGEKFHVVEYEDRLELIPIDDDPLQAVREAASDAFDGKSVDALRTEAREQARADAEAGFQRGKDSESGGGSDPSVETDE